MISLAELKNMPYGDVHILYYDLIVESLMAEEAAKAEAEQQRKNGTTTAKNLPVTSVMDIADTYGIEM